MPIKSIIGEAASKLTQEEFADELSSHTQLTSEQVQVLFPKKSDQEELAKLLEIVNSATDENDKKAKLAKNISSVGGAVLKIIKNFVPAL